MSRRGRGEGSVTRRADGRWMYRWTETDGKRRTGYAPTQADAVTALRDALTWASEGVPTIESADTFKAVAERWRKTATTRRGISAGTLGTYSSVLRIQVYPLIGERRMRELKPSHIAEVLMSMEAAGLSASYRSNALKAMSNVCKMAQADELIRRNPCRAVKTPAPDRPSKTVPTREQVTAMIAAAPDARTRALIVVLAFTGLRISEALSLRWADWDGAGTLRIHDTKGGKPRAVPVPETLAAELRIWRRAQAAERIAAVWWDTDIDWILSNEIGRKWDSAGARKRFRPVAEKECPGATPHSMRHATATLLLEQGVPMRVVSEVLGHSSTRITADTYSHVTARLLTEAGDAIQAALG